VLTESPIQGHTEHYAPARLTQPAPPARILRARVIAAGPDHLLMEAA
jgi:hypothetical protein